MFSVPDVCYSFNIQPALWIESRHSLSIHPAQIIQLWVSSNFIHLPSIYHPQRCLYILYTPANTHELPFSSSTFTASGFDGNIDSQGELILQESFQVWDPKTLIRKGRDRHLFLFEMSLVFSKEVKDSNGRSKYLYKSKLFVSNVVFCQTVLLLFFSQLHHLRSQSRCAVKHDLWMVLGSYGCRMLRHTMTPEHSCYYIIVIIIVHYSVLVASTNLVQEWSFYFWELGRLEDLYVTHCFYFGCSIISCLYVWISEFADMLFTSSDIRARSDRTRGGRSL